MRGTRFTFRFVICVLLAAASALRAQTNLPAQSMQPHLQPLGQAPAIAGVSVGGPFGVLTEEQRASYQTLMKAARGKLAELDTQLRAAQKDLLVTSVTGKFDEDVIREKALAAAKIQAEMVVLRAKVFSEVQPPLSPDQIEKIKSGQTAPPPRPLERPFRPGTPPASTNHDANGLPQKQ